MDPSNFNHIYSMSIQKNVTKAVILCCIAWSPALFGSTPEASTPAPAGSKEAEVQVEDCLDRYVAALGGKQALSRITSRRLKGFIQRNTAKVPFLLCQQAPCSAYTETRFPRPGTLKQGFDGKTAWMLHPQQGGRLVQGRERDELASSSWISPALRIREDFPVREWVGLRNRDGRPMVEVRLGKSRAEMQTWIFDGESHLLWKIEKKVDAGVRGEVLVVTTYEDYRKVDDIEVPFRIRTETPAATSILQFEKVEQNVVFDQQLFSCPF
jgi:hypothetical protein